jgi:hypothetical protein
MNFCLVVSTIINAWGMLHAIGFYLEAHLLNGNLCETENILVLWGFVINRFYCSYSAYCKYDRGKPTVRACLLHDSFVTPQQADQPIIKHVNQRKVKYRATLLTD